MARKSGLYMHPQEHFERYFKRRIVPPEAISTGC